MFSLLPISLEEKNGNVNQNGFINIKARPALISPHNESI